jgi:hypothetical protein
MRTTTTRIFEEDVERARVIGAVRQQSAHEVLHTALDEYVTNHRVELEVLFNSVRLAVLSGDGPGLREAISREAARPDTDEARRAQERWEAE